MLRKVWSTPPPAAAAARPALPFWPRWRCLWEMAVPLAGATLAESAGPNAGRAPGGCAHYRFSDNQAFPNAEAECPESADRFATPW